MSFLVVRLMFVAFTLSHVTPKPFLYSPSAFTTFLASASSASSSQSSDNIADLREKQVTSLKLTGNVGNEEQNEEDDFFRNEPLEEDEPAGNEAVPGLFQKKINKILRKVQLISSLSGIGSNNGDGNDDGSEPTNFDFDFHSGFENSTDVEVIATTTTTAAPAAPSRLTAESVAIYLMELVGSIFGLTYGAAAQLQQTTTSKPNIVS